MYMHAHVCIFTDSTGILLKSKTLELVPKVHAARTRDAGDAASRKAAMHKTGTRFGEA